MSPLRSSLATAYLSFLASLTIYLKRQFPNPVLKDIPSLPMIGSYSIQDPSSPPPCRIPWRGVSLLEALCKEFPSMGSINLGVYLLVYLVISIDYLIVLGICPALGPFQCGRPS
jgi:hypothetical protein